MRKIDGIDRVRAGEVEVLHVEDDAAEAELLREVLDAFPGFTLRRLKDGAAALAHLRQAAAGTAVLPDLILLDLNLPIVDGRRVLAQIKRDPTLRTIPVIVLSGSSFEPDVTLAYELGANAYVVKPFQLEEYRRVARSLCEFWCGMVMPIAQRRGRR